MFHITVTTSVSPSVNIVINIEINRHYLRDRLIYDWLILVTNTFKIEGTHTEF